MCCGGQPTNWEELLPPEVQLLRKSAARYASQHLGSGASKLPDGTKLFAPMNANQQGAYKILQNMAGLSAGLPGAGGNGGGGGGTTPPPPIIDPPGGGGGGGKVNPPGGGGGVTPPAPPGGGGGGGTTPPGRRGRDPRDRRGQTYGFDPYDPMSWR